MFATNVIGLIGMTQQLVKREHSFSRSIDPPSPFYSYTVLDFKAKQSGHVINIGSIAGREPYVGGSIYNATKFAVKAFTGSLMRELVNTPIRVSEIQPGRSLFSSLHLPSLILSILGMVETEFSIVRFGGDKGAADKVYEGLEPCNPSHYDPEKPI